VRVLVCVCVCVCSCNTYVYYLGAMQQAAALSTMLRADTHKNSMAFFILNSHTTHPKLGQKWRNAPTKMWHRTVHEKREERKTERRSAGGNLSNAMFKTELLPEFISDCHRTRCIST
jgi:hypothetical protein